MRRYLLRFAATILVLVAAYLGIVLFLRAPIGAEYFVGEMMVVKREQAAALASPKIVFLGGSSTLLSIDAKAVARALDLPAENFGLHASMRLEWLLAEGDRMMRSGDTLVLVLEHNYYDCDGGAWDDWQLRNALAWHREDFDRLALWRRIEIALTTAKTPSLALELVGAEMATVTRPQTLARRIEALAPAAEIVARYRSDRLRTQTFAYSAFNLDDSGDLLNNDGAFFAGRGDPSRPARICSTVADSLRGFVAAMRGRGVRVLVAHVPYAVEPESATGWQDPEALFAADIADIGAELLDRRDELFLPARFFFDTSLHLNAAGRTIRTDRLIADLAARGIGNPAPR
jgi:hypothetical protein